MTHLYLKLLICSFVVTGLMAIAAPLGGQFRPANPVLDGIFKDCADQPQPCWYGIRPGKTAFADALKKVRATAYAKLDERPHGFTVVYRNATMRCGVEIRSEGGIVDTVTIINCLDKQVGDLVKAMHNADHKLPFSMGMLDAIMRDEIGESEVHDPPCLNYTSYGQIIGMPLGTANENAVTTPANWHDFLPYGWYVHTGGTLSCDTVDMG